MSVVCPTAVRLPDYLADVPAGAHTQYRRRLISWTIADPGELHRNRYAFAYLEVTEREPWKGEPLWLSAQRRTTAASHMRTAFTDAARQRIHDEIVPAVARYGFDRLWLELSRKPSSYRSAENARREADEARKVAEWWSVKAELLDMHRDGLVEFTPVARAPLGQRDVSVRVCHMHQHRFSHEQPVARALVDGVHLGWVLDNGDIVPLDDLVR